MDDREAATGTAALHISYSLGGLPQSQRLPIKSLKLQPIRKGAGTHASYRAFVTSRVHLQLYRMVHTLFPILERWDRELRSGNVLMIDSTHPAGTSTAPASVEQVRAKTTDDGLLLELHCAQTGITARARVTINFRLACLELQTLEAGAADSPTGSGGYPSSICLRTLHSLEEAVAALHVNTERLAASPSITPKSSSGGLRSLLTFQSPAKPPRRSSRVMDLVQEGVALVEGCSSAQIREGATMLQTAAAAPGGAVAGIEAGAMEALVSAASTVLPSTIMGTTEQLTLLALTIAALLDGDIVPEGGGAARLVTALAHGLQMACANPVLLCKLLVALLQRPDVRLEAMQQQLWSTISATYLRKSPLLEPLAAALLSPSVVSSASKQRQAAMSSAASDAGSLQSSPSGSRAASTPSGPGKLGIPRLVLTTEADTPVTTPPGGLTRATRRELSATPTEWHPPAAPWGSPRTLSAAKDTSASTEMDILAEALGESLMAMDLPSAVAHRRRAEMKDFESEAGSIPPGKQYILSYNFETQYKVKSLIINGLIELN